jgi:polysaccharide biosynthesis protein PslG
MGRLRRAVSILGAMGLVLGASFAGFGGPAAPPAAAATPIPAIGAHFHAMWTDYSNAQRIAVLDKLAAAKVGWVRIDMGWAAFEENGKGTVATWYKNIADFTIDAARARGIKVLGTLWQTPGWANNNRGVMAPPNNPQDYADFARWAAGYFKGRVSAWEIWNEPNLDYFWTGADPVKYAQLVRTAYPAYKAGDPSALVVAGSTSQNDTDWLRRMYDAGAGGYFDVLSTHPYQGPIDAKPEIVDDGNFWIMDHVGAVKQLMAARGDGAKAIWATEFGWSSHANNGTEASWDRGVSEAVQADYLVRAINWFAARHPYVTNMFWYNERNKATGDVHQDNFGLLRRDLSEKPAYAALKNFLATATTVDATTALVPAPASASAPAAAPAAPPDPITLAPDGLSYRLVTRDGRTFGFDEAGPLPATGPLPVGRSGVVAAVATPSGGGAWVTTEDGAVFATGNAPFVGSMGGARLNKAIVGMDGTPSGNGYWLVASDGGIFSFGDARFHGSTGAIKLNKPIVGMAATPSGNGYWLVASDGGIFAFGDARFFGSTGAIKLNQPIVGMAPTRDGNGYWLVASDGGIFAFGNAVFRGSTGAIRLNQPITGMVPTPSGNGYWFVAADGGVFSFGDARFLGSAANLGVPFAGMVAPAR